MSGKETMLKVNVAVILPLVKETHQFKMSAIAKGSSRMSPMFCATKAELEMQELYSG